jgi:hypothetical protein
MERIVYCPDESKLEDAQHLAREWNVSVQLGESLKTEALDFDRSAVQLVNIPTEQQFTVRPIKPAQNRRIRVEYLDEFHPIKDVWLRCDHESGFTEHHNQTVMSTKHAALFSLRLSLPGKYDFSVYDADGVIATEKVEVV